MDQGEEAEGEGEGVGEGEGAVDVEEEDKYFSKQLLFFVWKRNSPIFSLSQQQPIQHPFSFLLRTLAIPPPFFPKTLLRISSLEIQKSMESAGRR